MIQVADNPYTQEIQYGMFYYGNVCKPSLIKQMLKYLESRGYNLDDIERNGRWSYIQQRGFRNRLTSAIKVSFRDPRGVLRVV